MTNIPKFNQQSGRGDSSPRFLDSNQGGVRELAEKLCQFLDPHKVLDSPKGPWWPLVILAFNESHVLSDPMTPGDAIFFQLHCTL